MNKITLYQKTKNNKIKYLTFWTEGPKFFTRWGLLDGKSQETVKVCKGMNFGKANETTPSEQAIAEMNAKIVIKKKEGYSETKPDKNDTIVQAKIDLDNIPEAFCPNKPISKTPPSIIDGKETYGQRKFDGHCMFLVKGKTTEKIYSRRMEDQTEVLKDIPPIKAMMSDMPKGTFLLTEFVFIRKSDNKQTPRFVAQVVRLKEAKTANERYTALLAFGKFECVPFDVLFFKGEFVGDMDYIDRKALAKTAGIVFPPIFKDWQAIIPRAKSENWEGFVLRVPGDKSHISYTMDGEAHRAGSYKYKFLKTDEFFVTEWLKGKSGKHANFYAKFRVAQYDDTGNVIDRGYVGPGKLTHEELEEITEQIDTQKLKRNFVVEVEYQDIQDTGKLQFGIIQRLRPDKTHKECVAE